MRAVSRHEGMRTMKLATSRLLDKADVALDTAAKLLDGGDPERSVGRSYYAMFYAGEAAICEDAFRQPPDLSTGGRFDGYPSRGKTADAEYHRWLRQASNEQLEGGPASPTPAQAARSMDLAAGLIAEVRRRSPAH